ncbi:hypothetical protein [Nocardia tengchongensis]|uniref:hypothetical protein n=1 Tax=Nocardia tengchongensis TaxID=2055889 RepID=UPI0036B90FEF
MATATTSTARRPMGLLQRLVFWWIALALNRASELRRDRKEAADKVDITDPKALLQHAESAARDQDKAVQRLANMPELSEMNPKDVAAALTDAATYRDESPLARAKLDEIITFIGDRHGLTIGANATTVEVDPDFEAESVQRRSESTAENMREQAAASAASTLMLSSGVSPDTQQDVAAVLAGWVDAGNTAAQQPDLDADPGPASDARRASLETRLAQTALPAAHQAGVLMVVDYLTGRAGHPDRLGVDLLTTPVLSPPAAMSRPPTGPTAPMPQGAAPGPAVPQYPGPGQQAGGPPQGPMAPGQPGPSTAPAQNPIAAQSYPASGAGAGSAAAQSGRGAATNSAGDGGAPSNGSAPAGRRGQQRNHEAAPAQQAAPAQAPAGPAPTHAAAAPHPGNTARPQAGPTPTAAPPPMPPAPNFPPPVPNNPGAQPSSAASPALVDRDELTHKLSDYVDTVRKALEMADTVAADPTVPITADMYWVADRMRDQRAELLHIAANGPGLLSAERTQIQAIVHDVDMGKTELPSLLWLGEDYKSAADRELQQHRGAAIADLTVTKVTDALAEAGALDTPKSPDLRRFTDDTVRDAVGQLAATLADPPEDYDQYKTEFRDAADGLETALVKANVEEVDREAVQTFLFADAQSAPHFEDRPDSVVNKIVGLLEHTPVITDTRPPPRPTPENVERALDGVRTALQAVAAETKPSQRTTKDFRSATSKFGQLLGQAGIDPDTRMVVDSILTDQGGTAAAHAHTSVDRVHKWAARGAVTPVATAKTAAEQSKRRPSAAKRRTQATSSARSTFSSTQRRNQTSAAGRTAGAANAAQASARTGRRP